MQVQAPMGRHFQNRWRQQPPVGCYHYYFWFQGSQLFLSLRRTQGHRLVDTKAKIRGVRLNWGHFLSATPSPWSVRGGIDTNHLAVFQFGKDLQHRNCYGRGAHENQTHIGLHNSKDLTNNKFAIRSNLKIKFNLDTGKNPLLEYLNRLAGI